MRVAVRLNGPMAALLGPRQDVDLPDGALVGDLVAVLARRAGADDLPGLAVAIRGTVVDARHPLEHGDSVAVLSPVAGG